ncbi:helix-turn-helix domain-containing protein [Palleronia caenipelagi]|uniref:HTH cro/C1-type domain-containing protein n=1 Tax=Palleronia caenipelagi TaxID=2489174 RepID=A0A547PN24_9RHOB|nr:hypothetical protein [Palleronia caenipelagi]TRD15529.1 hypothetical protein FEV53_16010 [Palleronia caenipelagi]
MGPEDMDLTESDLHRICAEAFKSVRERPEMTWSKMADDLGISKKSVERYKNGERDVPLSVWLKFCHQYQYVDHRIAIAVTPVGSDHPESETSLPQQRSTRPDLSWWQWLRGHLRLIRRLGPRGATSDPWRNVRDWILMVACAFTLLKFLHTKAGLHFGLTNTYADPLLLISILLSAVFGYALIEDFVRKRYFLGANR